MSESAVLFIHALTGLHPGSGTALGVVDLPVQRERHTQWPVIPGSSLKGILRSTCHASDEDRDRVFAVFGPEPTDADAHAGALSLTDARILAFPVRSLRGVFAWVTCAAVLTRLQRDLALVAALPAFGPFPDVSSNQAACAPGSPLIVGGDKLVLEEFEFSRTADATEAAQWIASQSVADEGTRERIESHLVVLHDDDFTHFVRHATEVLARVGLDYATKTVKKGALFYEEFLPAETLFYALVFAEDSRRKEMSMNAGEVVRYIGENLPPVLQIGADETIGKGFCAVRLAN